VTPPPLLTHRLWASIGAVLGDAELGRVFERFATTSRYEWMFWDAAWRQERWPV
jgi:thiaminase/transcriptional activator TenA